MLLTAKSGQVGLLLSSDDHSATQHFERVAGELLGGGKKVFAYLLHSGVTHVQRAASKHLIAQGLHVHVCSLGAEKYGIPFSDRAVFCGLGSLASIIQHTDAFYSFSSHEAGGKQPGPHSTVILAANHDPQEASGTTLETLRVSAGLAQLSTLKVELCLEGKARRLLEDPLLPPDIRQEGIDHVQLLESAGGLLLANRHSSAGTSLTLRLG